MKRAPFINAILLNHRLGIVHHLFSISWATTMKPMMNGRSTMNEKIISGWAHRWMAVQVIVINLWFVTTTRKI